MDKEETGQRTAKRYIKWTKEQKRTVIEYYRLGYNFAKIAEMVKRSEKSCRNLVYLLPRTETSNKGKWSVEEITLLRKGIETHGKNWAKVSEFVGTRTPMQCKNMYYNILGRTNTDLAVDENSDNLHLSQFSKYSPSQQNSLTASQNEIPTSSGVDSLQTQSEIGDLIISPTHNGDCPPELIVEPPPNPNNNNTSSE